MSFFSFVMGFDTPPNRSFDFRARKVIKKKKLKKKLFCLCACFFFGITALHAQTAPAGEDTKPAEPVKNEPKRLTPEEVLERDIATSSFSELADWCRSLGLSESGTANELASRLRNHYKLEAPGSGEGPPGSIETEQKLPLVIAIDSARSSEYFTIEAVNEEYVRLKGGVSISLKDGEILHTIKAEEILYNRTRNVMSASGGVAYTKKDGDTIETFSGQEITVNLDTWATVFMEGFSERAITEGINRYRFSGEVISRSADDSIVLKNAEITNADEEEAYWSIAASKLWLLPGSDWAVFNAVLKVGEIPLLWLPAFYYPADEIIFHPVFGYRSREGTFLQTTTYLLGRPKAQGSAEASTITSIMGSGSGMEKKREGVFLRSTRNKIQNQNETRLSLQADAYTNLGFYLGSDLTLPAKAPFGETAFSAGLGISRDIVIDRRYSSYTPFAPGYDGTSNWHSSRFFSETIPFRYRFRADGSLSGSGGIFRDASLAWSFPLYSDPYMDNDFGFRSEDSDIFTLLLAGSSPDIVNNTSSLSSYDWKLDGRLNFDLPALSPYINTLSISSISSSLSFDKRGTKPERLFPSPPGRFDLSYPPDRDFFYPRKFTLFSLSAVVSGVPLTTGLNTSGFGTAQDASGDFLPGLGTPYPPWDYEEQKTETKQTEETLIPPAISRAVETKVLNGHTFVIDYYLNPSGSSELQFNSTDWKKQEDIDWGDTASQLYAVRADGNLGFTLSESRNLYSTSIRLYGTSAWQDYYYLNEEASDFNTKTKRDNAYRNIHSINRVSTSGEYNFTLRPFFGSEIWKNTNFQYTIRGILARTIYDRNDDSWSWEYGAWDKEHIETHQTQANINADIMEKTQSLLLSAELPPKEGALTGDATARIWISESNARSRIRRPFDDDRFYEPVYLTETLRFADKVFLRQYAVYTPELDDWTILTTSLTLWDLTASFTATRSRSYTLDTSSMTSGWKMNASDPEKLNPQELRINYVKTFTSDESKPAKLSLRINTGLAFDLQRYTYSKFTFAMGLTLGINKFIDMTLNSYSENSEIYRYYKSPRSDMPLKNPLEDLVESFRFDKDELRRRSGFKLKSFGFDLVHHLGDWDATLGVKLTPELTTSTPRQYRFNSTIAFLLQWKPIKELKTEINYDKDGLRY